jgi:lipoprotein-releasing system permease protein
MRVPLLLLASGLALAAGGSAGWLLAAGPAVVHTLSVLGMMVGGTLLVLGVVVLAFKLVTRGSVEWFLAWRYLQRKERPSLVAPIVGLVLVAFCVLSMLAARAVEDQGVAVFGLGVSHYVRGFQLSALGNGIFAYLVLFFAVMLRNFSLFTSISIFGVFLGTSALVIVLSVMGGFESDLRSKILGTTAHVVITRPKKSFTQYRHVTRQVSKLPGVDAISPYLESEVMVTSQTNLSGVLLRGIDPRRAGQVTALRKYLRAEGGAGRLSNLSHPERLAKLPDSQYRPLVSPPLGQGPDADGDGDGDTEQPEPGERAPPRGLKVPTPVGQKVPPRPVYQGIIIGAELAKNLRLYVGDDINVVAPLGGMSPMGPIPKSKPFRVAGIFYSGMYEYDTKFAYVTIAAAQRFLGLGDQISGIEIKTHDIEQATAIAAEVRQRLGQGRGYQVKDWKEMNVNLFSALKLERVVMFIVLTFIVLVASFSIITTLIMMVMEKRREIAALKSMGATNRSMLKVFLGAGLYIGMIGMLMGLFTGVSFCLFLTFVGIPLDPEVYYISRLPVEMDPGDILLVAFAGVSLSFLATIYPSLRAANLRPVDGLRRYTG